MLGLIKKKGNLHEMEILYRDYDIFGGMSNIDNLQRFYSDVHRVASNISVDDRSYPIMGSLDAYKCLGQLLRK
jgi:hypothetical protein